MGIAENIRSKRESMNLTQQELADNVGVSRSYIARVECESISPTLALAELIAETLNCEVTDLLGSVTE